jgi:hypothetical protein
VCTMFIVASFSVAGGLRTSMDTLKDNFTADTFIATKPGPSGPEFFGEASVSEMAGNSAFGILADAVVVPNGTRIMAFAVSGDSSALPEQFYVTGTDAMRGNTFPYVGNITLQDQTSVDVRIVGGYSSTVFPSNWLLCSVGTLQALTGHADMFNFLVIKDPHPADRTYLEDRGFSLQPLTSIVEFLDSGVREIESDAFWVLIPSSFVIAVLAYAFIGTETSDRRHDIGIIKTVGAGRRRVLSYLLLNALAISAWGGLVGVALGVVLSYGISTVASSLFTSVFVVKASESIILVSFVATTGAGLVGALGPAVKMTLTSPVDDLKEATRSS